MPHVWFPEGVPGEFPAFYVCRSGDVSIFNGFSAAKVSIAQRKRNGKFFLQGAGNGSDGEKTGLYDNKE